MEITSNTSSKKNSSSLGKSNQSSYFIESYNNTFDNNTIDNNSYEEDSYKNEELNEYYDNYYN